MNPSSFTSTRHGVNGLSFIEARDLGILGPVAPPLRPPRQPKTPTPLPELMDELRHIKADEAKASDNEGQIDGMIRSVEAERDRLLQGIEDAKTELVTAAGTSHEASITEGLRVSRAELQVREDRLEALRSRRRAASPSEATAAMGKRKKAAIQEQLLHGVELAELASLPPETVQTIHRAFSVSRIGDWSTWLRNNLPAPSQKDLANLKAEALARHGVEL